MSGDGGSRVLPWVVLGARGRALRGLGGRSRRAPSTRSVLTPHRLLALAAVLKLVYLLAGAAWAFACRDRLEADNPARPAWFLLSLGLLSTFVGQLCLAPFQVVRNETPVPVGRPTSSSCSPTRS